MNFRGKAKFGIFFSAIALIGIAAFWYFNTYNFSSWYRLSVLVQIADLVGLKNDGSFESLRAGAQESWLRPKGKERWETEPRFEDKRSALLPLFRRIGLTDEVLPKERYYDVIIINGGSVESMRMRLYFLNKIWSEGIHAREIYFLTGERPLNPAIESDDSLMNPEKSSVPWAPDWQIHNKILPKNESEAAAFLWDQVITHKDLKHFDVEMISLGMVEKAGILRRPNTYDTVLAWMDAYDPKDKKILNISNNPFIHYQDAVMRKVLDDQSLLEEDYTLETVGPKASEHVGISIYLDTIARTLYNEDAKKYN